jgi:hypothetical protein
MLLLLFVAGLGVLFLLLLIFLVVAVFHPPDKF